MFNSVKELRDNLNRVVVDLGPATRIKEDNLLEYESRNLYLTFNFISPNELVFTHTKNNNERILNTVPNDIIIVNWQVNEIKKWLDENGVKYTED